MVRYNCNEIVEDGDKAIEVVRKLINRHNVKRIQVNGIVGDFDRQKVYDAIKNVIKITHMDNRLNAYRIYNEVINVLETYCFEKIMTDWEVENIIEKVLLDNAYKKGMRFIAWKFVIKLSPTSSELAKINDEYIKIKRQNDILYDMISGKYAKSSIGYRIGLGYNEKEKDNK